MEEIVWEKRSDNVKTSQIRQKPKDTDMVKKFY